MTGASTMTDAWDWCLGVYPRETEHEREIPTNHLRVYGY
jgi:hypothetical protein